MIPSTDLGARFASYLLLQRALAPSYVEGAEPPPFAEAPADEQALTALAEAIGPLGPSLEAIFRVANGVRAFNLFSLDLRSASDIAGNRAADVSWLARTLAEITDDMDDDEELQSTLRTLSAAEPVLLGASSQRSELVLIYRAQPDADWSVCQLVNNRWWELPDNTSASIDEWISGLHGGAAADAESKGIS